MANTQTFTGDGTTTVFYFTFPFFGKNDINISVNGCTQTDDDFALLPTPTPGDADVPYTGGKITFVVAPANGATIKIWRTIEVARHIDYQATAEPKSFQLNQDLNQCIEILKEISETLVNVLSLANVPTLADILSELTTISDNLGTFASKSTVNDLSDTVDSHTTSITNLGNTVAGHTTSISTLTGYDYVTESQAPTADNNYTWYRKYKSGWVEQGGCYSGASDTCSVTLPKEMSNAFYTITALSDNNPGIAGSYTMIDGGSQTTTGFKIIVNFNGTAPTTKKIRWYICGMTA